LPSLTFSAFGDREGKKEQLNHSEEQFLKWYFYSQVKLLSDIVTGWIKLL